MVAQNTNNARRVFVVANAADLTAKKVYDAGAAAVPNSRRVYSVTPYDLTCHKVRIVAAGTPGAIPVTAVNATGTVVVLA